MKRQIKTIIKKLIPKRVISSHILYSIQLFGNSVGLWQRLRGTMKCVMCCRYVYPVPKVCEQLNAALQFRDLVSKFRFENSLTSPYFYPLDPYTYRILPPQAINIVSLTLDYGKVLTLNLGELRNKMAANSDEFSQSIVVTVDAIKTLQKRASNYYAEKTDERSQVLKSYIDRIIDTVPQTLDEALQKILFFNALLWYNRQRHIGLGRLDLILQPYLQRDIENATIDNKKAWQMLRDFVLTLAAHTKYKSVGLIGDTGQVILLSGIDDSGTQVENDITRIFIDIITELNIPDPKLILRVNEHTTPELWQRAIDCVAKGNGSPLIVNEAKIMRLMEQFGYEACDTVDFGTSACWEPLIIGKSFDQNNSVENINLPLQVLNIVGQPDFDSFNGFEKAFIEKAREHIADIAQRFMQIHFDYSPLHSIWMEGCVESLTDISQGGAKYNYHGFLVMGLPNAVNSLLNIKEYVFDKKIITQRELQEVLLSNYSTRPEIKALFEENSIKFGLSIPVVIDLTNRIMQALANETETTTINGHRVKLGFSSPGYIQGGVVTPATPDGRLAGEPFAVHISPMSKHIDFAEIIDFASQMDYSGNKINGNVVDFIVSRQFIKEKEKFGEILRAAFQKGVFEMQLNVLSVDKLIAAKSDPTLYPGLVVRVWGFSAYFNDLPEVYKDHLIHRAQLYA